MLAVWRDWGVIDILREAWESGVVLAGVSAGAICWFDQGLTDSFAGDLAVLDCMGFLDGSCSPHYDGEADRRPSYHKLIGAGGLAPGIALDDGAAAHFVDGKLKQVVTSRPNAQAYSVSIKDDVIVETPIRVRHLNGSIP